MLVASVRNWLLGNKIDNKNHPTPITAVVDYALKKQREMGHKQFKFVITAWVMDLAEYLPHLVDPHSDVYHGKNAEEAMNVCFQAKAFIGTRQAFLDAGTRFFSNLTGTYPMDVEDAAPGCDLIRWLENYVPKKGFQYVIDEKLFNSSCLTYPLGRQP